MKNYHIEYFIPGETIDHHDSKVVNAPDLESAISEIEEDGAFVKRINGYDWMECSDEDLEQIDEIASEF